MIKFWWGYILLYLPDSIIWMAEAEMKSLSQIVMTSTTAFGIWNETGCQAACSH